MFSVFHFLPSCCTFTHLYFATLEFYISSIIFLISKNFLSVLIQDLLLFVIVASSILEDINDNLMFLLNNGFPPKFLFALSLSLSC